MEGTINFYQIREWKIVVLDSADREHGVGEIDDIQIEWLERIYDKKDKIVVFVHHPLFWDDYLLQIGKNGKYDIIENNRKTIFF